MIYRLFFCAQSVGYRKRASIIIIMVNKILIVPDFITSQENMLQTIDMMDCYFRENNVSYEVWKYFDCFKVRVFILLIVASELSEDYKRYGTLLRKNLKGMSMPLSLRDRWVCILIKYMPWRFTYLIIRFLNNLKKIKLQLYN